MKKRRLAFVCSLALSISMAVTASAADYVDITVHNDDAHLNGYVNGVKGPGLLKDQVSYTSWLYGDIASILDPALSGINTDTAYIQPGTNDDF